MAGRAGGLISRSPTVPDIHLHGAVLFAGSALAMLPALADWYDAAPAAPGTRLTTLGPLAPHLTGDGCIAQIAAQLLGPDARPVRAIAFDKSPAANWALGWHQDRTINLAHRADIAGFGPWTVKQGSQHVQPPFALVEAMVTLRIHLDAVSADNAPLDVALGSHRLGYIPEARVPEVVEAARLHACLADAGDVWAYATPILHASRRSTSAGPRRVLQVDYSADTLPAPLEWALQS